jgi:hypothetical protein
MAEMLSESSLESDFDHLGSSPPQFDLPDTDNMDIESPSLNTTNSTCPQALARPITFEFLSSDPITTVNNNNATASSSAASYRPDFGLGLNRKRAAPPSPSLGHIDKTPRNTSATATIGHTAQTAILKARDLIVQAYTLTESHDEQSRILDLLEVFREYTEKGRLRTASTIIASQIANLETATRQIESKTKALASQPKQSSTSLPKPRPFSAVASLGASTNIAKPQEWTVVGNKPKPAKADLLPKAKDTSKRLILIGSNTTTSFSPLAARNAINTAFANKGIKDPVVASVTKTLSNNLVVTTTSLFSASFLLEKQAIWQHTLSFKSAQKDEPWHKVVLNGIPTADFNTPNGMELIISEIKTFNKGFTPIGTPYWLTSAEKRQQQRAGSVVVAFATLEEANRAIRHRLYVAGISVRVKKLYTTAPSSQCQKCQAFGHLDSYCRFKPKCRLCGESHATEQHYCTICKAKGAKCAHLAPKCVNCKEAHTADTKTCEILLAIKSKTMNTTTSL